MLTWCWRRRRRCPSPGQHLSENPRSQVWTIQSRLLWRRKRITLSESECNFEDKPGSKRGGPSQRRAQCVSWQLEGSLQESQGQTNPCYCYWALFKPSQRAREATLSFSVQPSELTHLDIQVRLHAAITSTELVMCIKSTTAQAFPYFFSNVIWNISMATIFDHKVNDYNCSLVHHKLNFS
jgi:hypothetical protein